MSAAILNGSVIITAAPLPRLRITARGRAVLLTLVTAPLVVAALALALNGGGATATGSSASVPLESVTVTGGQSLWELANEIAPTADPRDVISDIMSLNQLASAELQPGQRLDVPAKYTN